MTLTEGSYSNIKITTREDLPMEFRAGSGYDVHRLAEGRKLILCGEEITFEKGLLGHSDADVAVHASWTRCWALPDWETSADIFPIQT